MSKLITRAVLSMVTATAFVAAAPAAMAGGLSTVNWSINVGTGYAGARVYAPPAVVYVQPQPVYVQPATVVTYGQPYYYVDAHPRHGKKHGKHHHRHGHGHGHGHGYTYGY